MQTDLVWFFFLPFKKHYESITATWVYSFLPGQWILHRIPRWTSKEKNPAKELNRLLAASDLLISADYETIAVKLVSFFRQDVVL